MIYSSHMAFDAMAPYGELRETTVRLATWNTWARYSPWQDRERLLLSELRRVDADIVCLQEAWVVDDESQAERFGAHLEMEFFHHGDRVYDDVISGHAILAKWPITKVADIVFETETPGSGGGAVMARVDGPRGSLDVVSLMLEYRMDLGHIRQSQLAELCTWARDKAERANPLIICGDFNADPQSDEIRRLSGLAPVYAPNMMFYDAVSMAATGDTTTYSSRNPFAAVGLYPERQLDHIFSLWPKAHGAGHPVHAEVIGSAPVDELFASDHFGLFADLRY